MRNGEFSLQHVDMIRPSLGIDRPRNQNKKSPENILGSSNVNLALSLGDGGYLHPRGKVQWMLGSPYSRVYA